jgi:hypothetical protein
MNDTVEFYSGDALIATAESSMLIEKLLLTALLLTVLFYIAIVSRGDNAPTFRVKAIETIGFLISLVASFVFTLIKIWI